MIRTVYFILLFQCVALSTGGILVILRLKKRIGEDYISQYLYYLSLISLYGLYVLWGGGLLRYIFRINPPETFDLVMRFLNFLGIPFLVAAWYMLLRFTTSISGKRVSNGLLAGLAIFTVALLVLSGIYVWDIPSGWLAGDSSRLVFTLLSTAFCFVPGLLLLFIRQEETPWKASRPAFWLGFALILNGILQAAAHLLPGSGFWIDSLSILLFFAGLLAPVLVLTRSPLLRKEEVEETDSFKAFCKKFDISAREAEVVREIVLGKSNKEIADCLFISLQTVKDHAYNIFLKTEVRSRIQLANKVRAVAESGTIRE